MLYIILTDIDVFIMILRGKAIVIVALYLYHKPNDVIIGLGHEEFDDKCRYIEAKFNNIHVISIYTPSDILK